jgi:hypothetical protein
MLVLEINIEGSKYMLLTRHQNVGQNRDIKIANKFFENVSVQIFGNKSKFDSGGYYEEIKFRQYLLQFSPEPFVSSFVVEKCKN